MKRLLALLVLATTMSLPAQDIRYDLDTSLNNYHPIPPIPKPDYRQTIIDPVFGTRVTRITGDPGTAIPNTSGEVWKNVARHGYSSRQPWNADESVIWLEQNKNPGWGAQLFIDGDTYEVIGEANIPWNNESRWHPTDPDKILILRDNGIHHWSYSSGTLTQVFSLSGYSDLSLGYTGNWSFDGNTLAVSATRNSDGRQVAFTMNSATGLKTPDVDLSGWGIDYVTTSPYGDYIVVNGSFSGYSDVTKIYNAATSSQSGPFWSEYGRPSHYDVSIDFSGEQFVVGGSRTSPDDGRVLKRAMDDGEVTVLTEGGYNSHSSARAIQRYGWIFTPMSKSLSWGPYYNEVVAVSTDGRVERIASLRNGMSTYDNQPQPCPSPTGTKVMWASDWDKGSYPIQAYVVEFDEKRLSTKEYLQDAVWIYPNPTDGEVIIDIGREYELEVFDLNGKFITDKPDLTGQADGIYIFSITTNGRTVNKKVIHRSRSKN